MKYVDPDSRWITVILGTVLPVIIKRGLSKAIMCLATYKNVLL